MNKLREWRYRLIAFFYAICGRDHLCDCGHKAKWATYIEPELGVPGGLYLIKGLEYCPMCFVAATIRCAWCGHTIVPESPVTLYGLSRKQIPPEHAVIYITDDDCNYLVGCLRPGCGEMLDRQGFWVMPGKVDRVLSPLEECLGKDDLVICNDIADPSKAIHVEEIPG